MKKHILILFARACGALAHAQDTLSILFAGDAMGHTPQLQYAFSSATKTYNFEPNFRYLAPYLNKTDLNIVNMELTLAGAPYSGYPTFSTPDEFLYDLQGAGFDMVALANNHILDRGKKGLERTLEVLGDMPSVGVYRDAEDRATRYPLVFDMRGVRFALFNCTYATNGFSPSQPNIVNYLDTARIAADLASIADKDVDVRIMYVHWGVEYQLSANAQQRALAKWMAEKGFDLIIGGHPHVVQDAEVLTVTRVKNGERVQQQVPVVYSLGNYVSNQRWKDSNGGIMVRVDIAVNGPKVVCVDYIPCYVHKGSITYLKEDQKVTELHYFILPSSDYIKGYLPFRLDAQSEADLRYFHQATRTRLKNMPFVL